MESGADVATVAERKNTKKVRGIGESGIGNLRGVGESGIAKIPLFVDYVLRSRACGSDSGGSNMA